MRRIMLFSRAFLIALACAMSISAQALRIDSITPQPAEPGQTLVIQGSLGPPDHNKVIRLARVVDHQAQFFQATTLRWTRDQAEVAIPRTVPVDRYLVTIVYPERPTRHSNNFILTIREPPPPARAGRDDNPVVVLPNRCLTQPRRRTSRSRGDYEISTGAINAPCESMRRVSEENRLRAFPGDEIAITGDFGRRRADQYVALADFVEGDLNDQQRNQHRLRVSHLLQIVAWSTDQIRVRIGERVRPNDYSLLIINRISRNAVPGVFEQGSNFIHIRVRSAN